MSLWMRRGRLETAFALFLLGGAFPWSDNMLNKLAAVLLSTSTLLAAGGAQAQLPDLVEVSGQYMPGVEVDDTGGVEAQLSSYDAALNVPVPLGERTFLIPGLAYHVDSVSFANTSDDFIDLRAFHSVEVPLMLVQLLPRDWALALRVSPGLAGDFQAVDGRMLRVSALGMATKPVSDTLLMGGGAILSYGFGEWLPLPAVYTEWSPRRWLRLEAFVPAFARIDFLVGDRLEIGPRLDIAGNEYAIRDSRITESPTCRGEAANRQCMDHVAYSVGKAGLHAGIRVAGTLWLTADGGYSVFRRFEQLNRDGDRLSGGLHDLNNTWYLKSGLVWRIPMPEEEQTSDDG